MADKSNYDYVKRGLDIVGAGVGLAILSPAICAIGIIIRFRLGSPVIFKQQRPGRGGQLFTLYKFRSMKVVDENDDVENDHLRITPLGRTLRALSLDELPSLVNVLKGDMSVVGPRPLLAEYLSLYTTEQFRRHEVRPGITGLAQINGRNDLSWEDKFKHDLAYVENRSLKLDALILFRTISTVLQKRGVAKEGLTTTDRFVGGVSCR